MLLQAWFDLFFRLVDLVFIVLARCLSGACTVLLRCNCFKAGRRRDFAVFLLHVRVLVLCEVDDLDIVVILCAVPNDEAVIMELLQHSTCLVGIDIVISEQRLFDASRSIFQPAFAVCDAP